MSFDVRNIAPVIAPSPVKGIAAIVGKGKQGDNDGNAFISDRSRDFFATNDVVVLSDAAKSIMSKIIHDEEVVAFKEQDVTTFRKETSVDLRNDGVSNVEASIFEESQNDIRAASKFNAEVALKKILSDIMYNNGAFYDQLV